MKLIIVCLLVCVGVLGEGQELVSTNDSPSETLPVTDSVDSVNPITLQDDTQTVASVMIEGISSPLDGEDEVTTTGNVVVTSVATSGDEHETTLSDHVIAQRALEAELSTIPVPLETSSVAVPLETETEFAVATDDVSVQEASAANNIELSTLPVELEENVVTLETEASGVKNETDTPVMQEVSETSNTEPSTITTSETGETEASVTEVESFTTTLLPLDGNDVTDHVLSTVGHTTEPSPECSECDLTGEESIFIKPYEKIGTVEYVVGSSRILGERLERDNNEMHVFRGLPYANPPAGQLRFQAPVEYKLPPGKLIATNFGPACPQPPHLFSPDINATSEDCLYLNIWISQNVQRSFHETQKLAPVVVLIHGGGFSIGSGSQSYVDGTALAENDLVVVSINYRLGIFGFLDFYSNRAPGNMGLLDQLMALKWINRHIEKFYGDPKSVTLLGVSAGAFSIASHLLHEESRYYFHRAVLDGSYLLATSGMESFRDSTARGLEVSRIVGCPYSEYVVGEVLDCLEYKSTQELMDAQKEVAPGGWGFMPTYGSHFMPYKPEEMMKHIAIDRTPPILIGTAADEGTLFLHSSMEEPPETDDPTSAIISNYTDFYKFVPVDANETAALYSPKEGKKWWMNVSNFVGDALFHCSTIDFANRFSALGANATVYLFDFLPRQSMLPAWLKVHHGSSYAFFAGFYQSPLSNITSNRHDQEISHHFVKMITRFASGDTTDGGAPLQYNGTDLAGYNASRTINYFNSEGQLEFREGHPREKTCYRAWISKDAIPQGALSEITTTAEYSMETVSEDSTGNSSLPRDDQTVTEPSETAASETETLVVSTPEPVEPTDSLQTHIPSYSSDIGSTDLVSTTAYTDDHLLAIDNTSQPTDMILSTGAVVEVSPEGFTNGEEDSTADSPMETISSLPSVEISPQEMSTIINEAESSTTDSPVESAVSTVEISPEETAAVVNDKESLATDSPIDPTVSGEPAESLSEESSSVDNHGSGTTDVSDAGN